MKGNQGLEALAALCGGQSDAPTEESRALNSLRGTQANESATVAALGTSGQARQPQSNQESALQQAQRQNPLSNAQSALQNVSQQQWQQAIAAAAALQGNTMNQTLAAQSLLLSAGLPTQQPLGENAFSAMQQLALHQYVQAQAKLTAQQAAAQTLVAGGKAGIAFGDQNQQALMLALAAGKAQQLQGMFIGSF